MRESNGPLAVRLSSYSQGDTKFMSLLRRHSKDLELKTQSPSIEKGYVVSFRNWVIENFISTPHENFYIFEMTDV